MPSLKYYSWSSGFQSIEHFTETSGHPNQTSTWASGCSKISLCVSELFQCQLGEHLFQALMMKSWHTSGSSLAFHRLPPEMSPGCDPGLVSCGGACGPGPPGTLVFCPAFLRGCRGMRPADLSSLLGWVCPDISFSPHRLYGVLNVWAPAR